jgi:hypothetical protein
MTLRRLKSRLLLVSLIFAGCLAMQWPPSAQYLADLAQESVAALSWQKAKY